MVARPLIAVSIGAFLLGGCGDGTSTESTGGTAESSSPTTIAGRVASVTDGDTIRVDTGGEDTERVRLVGIDSPETRDPDTAAQCYGAEATRTLEGLLPVRTRVRLQSDPTQDTRDRYGRLLAYVYRPGETVSINEMLVSRGAAKVYVYRGTPFAQHPAFVAAETTARSAKRGLWGACVAGG